MRKAGLRLLFLLSVGGMFFAGSRLISIYREYAVGDRFYNSLAAQARRPSVGTSIALPGSTAETEPVETAPFSLDFDVLEELNGDIVGWIYCEDTPIDYPIVQSADNSYYLKRMPDGQYNSAGAIFLDYRCDGYFMDRNSIVYGHNMKNDSMFGTLPEYRNQSYYDAHPVMWLFTRERTYKIELLAGFVTVSDSAVYEPLYDADELQNYLSAAIRDSCFEAGVEPERVTRSVTLSTCSYEYENARFVLVGSLIPVGA